jgi:hypothetical protein
LRKGAEHYFIRVNQADTGYVDKRSGVMSGLCGLNVPVDSGPLQAHPTVCVFTSHTQEIPLYADPELHTPKGKIPANSSFAVTQHSINSYYVYIDHAFGGWVSSASGTLGDRCTVIFGDGKTVTTLENARIWSEPDVFKGQMLATLPVGFPVKIVAGPVRGPVSLTTNESGDWYKVEGANTSGWVWSARLAFETATLSAITKEEARVWSLPNVKQGQLTVTLPPNATVQILAGPVSGPVRLDTDEVGNWYKVRYTATNVTGWIWDRRLTFIVR